MKQANVSELKNRLSHYLRLVKKGESVLVKDRDRVIARLEPVLDPSTLEDAEGRRLAELSARGALRGPKGKSKLTLAWIRRRQVKPRKPVDVVRAILDERRSGW